LNDKHKTVLWAIKVVFFSMFAYSAYNKLSEALAVTKKETKRSYKLLPEKGIFGTVKEIIKVGK